MSSQPHVVVLVRRRLSKPGRVAPGNPLGPCEFAALSAARAIAGTGGLVTALVAGHGRREQKAIDAARAAGANAAVRVGGRNIDKLDYLATAKILAAAIGELPQPAAIVCGDRSADHAAGAVGPAVAEVIGSPHFCGVIDASLDRDDQLSISVRSLGMVNRYRAPSGSVLCVRSFSEGPHAGSRPADPIKVRSLKQLALSPDELARRCPLAGDVEAMTRPAAPRLRSAADLLAKLREDELIR